MREYQQPQYTLVKDGQAYHTDIATQNALKAVQRLDPGAAQTLFDRWHESGLIQNGSEMARQEKMQQSPITSRSQEQGIER